MPMSPRLKMRRGRFGPGGFKGPVLRLTGPEGSPPGGLDNFALGAGSPPTRTLTFTATAFDDLDGDISANIEWFVTPFANGLPASQQTTGSPAVATGASVDLGPFLIANLGGSPANFITAQSTDAGGKVTTVSRTIEIHDN